MRIGPHRPLAMAAMTFVHPAAGPFPGAGSRGCCLGRTPDKQDAVDYQTWTINAKWNGEKHQPAERSS